MKYLRKEDFYHAVMTNTKTKTKTNTETKTKTKTKCKEDPTYAIFLKTREFKDIKYDQTRTDKGREEKNPISRT